MYFFNKRTFIFLWMIMPIDGKRKEHRISYEKHSQSMEVAFKEGILPKAHLLNELSSRNDVVGLRRNNISTYGHKRVHSKKKESNTSPLLRFSRRLDLNQTSKTRFLDVFNMIEFDHVTCSSSDGLEGICVHSYECESSGGTDMGECADGYGTCCITQFSCDVNSSSLLGWFTNPDFPSPTTEILDCTLSVNKVSEDIIQFRVDFKKFELLPPTAGTCQQDQFIISGQNINNVVPILCGINNEQHVYVEVGHMNGPFYFTIQTISSANRLFSMKITQLTENDELAAPSGCLQYFKEPEGSIQSFNYFENSELGVKRTPTYLNNLNYAICIERASECCSVTYSNSGYMQIINYDMDGFPVIPPNQAGVELFNCPNDWLLIAATRLCGDRFNDGSVIEDFSYNAPITDTTAGPIVVWFRSDSAYVARGFKLEYQQNVCRNSIK